MEERISQINLNKIASTRISKKEVVNILVFN